jgi:hydrogenase maturation protease
VRERVLIAGVGNVFLSDDGFGVEVARRLDGAVLPPGVEVADVGIRGMHLAYRLLDGYRAVVLVDAVRRDGPPGTLYLLEHDLDQPPGADAGAFDAHGMDPAVVLTMLDGLATGIGVVRPVGRVLVLGCEPQTLDEGLGLSTPVAAAVERAVPALIDLVGELVGPVDPERNTDDPLTARGAARGDGDRGRAVAP